MSLVIKKIEKLLQQVESIKQVVPEVSTFVQGVKKNKEDVVNFVRGVVQNEAVQALNDNNGGIVVMATGAGKTKVALDFVANAKGKIGLVVPTQKLRDEGWKEEFVKWGYEHLLPQLFPLCYASAHTIYDQEFEYVIFDEVHHITELKGAFFINNKIGKFVGLTATYNFTKQSLFSSLGFETVYELNSKMAVKLGFVAPYEVNVIYVPVEVTRKEIKAGSKAKPFMTTEAGSLNYLDKQIEKYRGGTTPESKKRFQFFVLERKRFLATLPSKQKVLPFLFGLKEIREGKTLIFTQTTEQANTILGQYVFHSKSSDYYLEAFKRGEIVKLAVVNALDEGHNIPDLDCAVMLQAGKSSLKLIQRIGRTIRYKDNHKAHIFILVASGTKEEDWVEESLVDISEEFINRYSLKEFKEIREVCL